MATEDFETINVENISELSTTIGEFRESNIPSIILGPPGIGKSAGIMQSLGEEDGFKDVRASQLDPIDVRGVPSLKNTHEAGTKKLEYLERKVKFHSVEQERQESMAQSLSERAEAADGDEAQKLADKAAQAVQAAEEAGNQADAIRSQMASVFDEVDEASELDIDSEVVWSRPNFWPRSGKGIIVLEEINTATPSVQNTLLQPLGAPPNQDRYVGEHRIPKDWYWCATGNRKEDFAHVVPMSTAFRNRVMMVNIDTPNLEGWTHWALQNEVHPYVVGFIRFKPDMLYQAPDKQDENVGFPTPRSWTRMISPLIDRNMASVNLFKGAVGKAAATEFYSYVTELKDMPDIDKLLDGTVAFKPSEYKVSVTYAIVTSLVARCQEDTGKLTNAMNLIDQVKPEHGAIFVSNMLRSDDKQIKADTVANKTVVQWAQKHRQLIEKESS